MKKTVLKGMVLLVALCATACGGGGERDVSIDADHARPEILYLGSATGITALAPARGHVRFQQSAAVPSRDWSVLYTTTNDGVITTLRTLDPPTGEEVARRTVPGVFAVRTVSEDGAMVALTPPAPTGIDTYHP